MNNTTTIQKKQAASMRKTRLLDIAAAVGVSESTVAKVLNNGCRSNTRVSEKTRTLILEAAARMHYSPNVSAQRLAGQSSRLVGVIIDTRAPWLRQNLLCLIEKYLDQLNYKLLIGQTHDNLERIQRYADEFISYGVDGVICLAHDYPGDSGAIADHYCRRLPTVFLEKPQGSNGYHYVTLNVEQSYFDMTRYLIGKGRRQVAVLVCCRPGEELENLPQVVGYRRALADCRDRAPMPEVFIGIGLESRLSDDEYASCVIPELRKHGVDAVVCGNDELGCMLQRNLFKAGFRLPEEVAVCGYENSAACLMAVPSLTSVDCHLEEVAVKLVDRLLALLNDPQLPTTAIPVKTALLERESSAR